MKRSCLKFISPCLGRKGMTLIEVMVFAVILGIMAGIYATYFAYQAKQNVNEVKNSQFDQISIYVKGSLNEEAMKESAKKGAI